MTAAVPALLVLLLFSGPAFAGGHEAGGAASPRKGLPVAADRPLEILLSSWLPLQGEPVFVSVFFAPAPDNVFLVWKGKTFPMKEESPGRFLGVVGVDFLEPPGPVPLAITATRGGFPVRVEIPLTVGERAFPVQKLTLPPEKTDLDAATLERVREEARLLEEKLSLVSAPPAWEFPFLPPLADYRPENFGARRIVNGEPRAPHGGADVKVPEGTPVTAIAAGKIVYAGEQFFGGRSVVVDHGGGLFSVYYHLRDVAVAEGRDVKRGDPIGAAGSTGRSSGPHLHIGVRAPGGRIDPSLLFEKQPR